MASHNVPNTQAVKDYVRKNATPSWQGDLPYQAESPVSLVFGSDGTIYKCIQTHNQVDPYDDPKDPTILENQDVIWEVASGGGGVSESEYDVDFAVIDTDRKVIAISDEGTIELADPGYSELGLSETVEELIDETYPNRYVIPDNGGITGRGFSPYLATNGTSLMRFSAIQDPAGNGVITNEAIRSEMDFTSPQVLNLASPRPLFRNYLQDPVMTSAGTVVMPASDVSQSDATYNFFRLRGSQTNWERTLITTAWVTAEFSINATIRLLAPVDDFVVIIFSYLTDNFIIRYYPETDTYDEAIDFSGIANLEFRVIGNETAKTLTHEVVDGNLRIFGQIVGPSDYVAGYSFLDIMVPDVAGVAPVASVTAEYNFPPPVNSSGRVPIGFWRGDPLVGIEGTDPTTSGTIYVFDSGGGMTLKSQIPYIYSDASNFSTTFKVDTENDVAVINRSITPNSSNPYYQFSRDLIEWELIPNFPTFVDFSYPSSLFKIYNGQYIIYEQNLFGVSDSLLPYDFIVNSFDVVITSSLNRYKALGITSSSKATTEPEMVNKITVQKIGILEGFTGLTVASPVFMGFDGAITQNIEDIGLGEYRVLLGYAVSATDVDIQMGEPILNNPNETILDALPVGMIYQTTVDLSPTGSVDCSGGELSRSGYTVLNGIYAAAGYPYGNGDGSTTFNVPNLNVDGVENWVVKARYISDLTVGDNAEMDQRLLTLEDKYNELSGYYKATYETENALAGVDSFPLLYGVGDPIDLYINGIKQSPSSFTALTGTTIDLVTPLVVDSAIYIVVFSEIANITEDASTIQVDSGSFNNISGAEVQSVLESVDIIVGETSQSSDQNTSDISTLDTRVSDNEIYIKYQGIPTSMSVVSTTARASIEGKITAMASNRVAYFDQDSSQYLYMMELQGADWVRIGSPRSISIDGLSPSCSLCAITSNRIAFTDNDNDTLRTYEFDESNWVQVGSSLALTIGAAAMTRLNSNTIAMVDGGTDSIRTFSFDESNWAQVGSSLAIATGVDPQLTSLTSSRVAFLDQSTDIIVTYDFDGTTWLQVSTAGSFPNTNAAIEAISFNRIVISATGSSAIYIYEYVGSEWQHVSTHDVLTNNVTEPSITTLGYDRIVVVDATGDKYQTFDISFESTPGLIVFS